MVDNYSLVQVLIDARQREIAKILAAKLEIIKLTHDLIDLGVDMSASRESLVDDEF